MADGDGAAIIGPRVGHAPAGDWADLPAFVRTRAPRPAEQQYGRCFWLSDTQVDLTGPKQVALSRIVSEVTTQEGLQGAASISLVFDPAYETLIFHHVRVIRDGVTREVDPRRGLELYRRERDLERAMYDGRLTAHVVIPDLRVGDVVDLAHSRIGSHPTFAGRFAAEWLFDWSCWVGDCRVRLLAPAGRAFEIRKWNAAPEPTVRELADGTLERTWRLTEVPPAPYEPEAPPWIRRHATVFCADRMTWREAAEAFRPLYAPQPLPPELEAETVRIAAASADPAVRAMAALRLVQGALRYHSVAIGEGGFAPRPVAEIWGDRAGDCKDASRVLVSVLRRLGLEACPALVNTWNGPAVVEEPPNLTAFDHCIVRLSHAGRDYWLDGVLQPQGGVLATVAQARFGWALPLSADADLTFMGEDQPVVIADIRETIDFGPEPDSPAEARIETVYAGWRADGLRRHLENAADALAHRWLEGYAQHYGDVAATAPVTVSDDPTANRLVVVENYRIFRPWRPSAVRGLVQFQTLDEVFGPNLGVLRAGPRRFAIYMGPPRTLLCETVLNLPRPLEPEGWDEAWSMPGLAAASRLETEAGGGRTVRLKRRLEIGQAAIPAEAAGRFFEVQDAALQGAGLTVQLRVAEGRFAEAAPPAPGARALGLLSRGLGALAVGLLGLFLLGVLALLTG